MHWPDPPMCCQHGVNTHGRERCQAPQCGCEKDRYLTQRQLVLQQKAAAPAATPVVNYRWQLIARLDGTLEIELNKAVFGEGDDNADAALAEVRATWRELAEAKPAEDDVG